MELNPLPQPATTPQGNPQMRIPPTTLCGRHSMSSRSEPRAEFTWRIHTARGSMAVERFALCEEDPNLEASAPAGRWSRAVNLVGGISFEALCASETDGGAQDAKNALTNSGKDGWLAESVISVSAASVMRKPAHARAACLSCMRLCSLSAKGGLAIGHHACGCVSTGCP